MADVRVSGDAAVLTGQVAGVAAGRLRQRHDASVPASGLRLPVPGRGRNALVTSDLAEQPAVARGPADPVRVSGIGHRGQLNELDRRGVQPLQTGGDADHGPQAEARVCGHVPGRVGDYPDQLAGAGGQVGALEALQQRCHQVLVAPDALQVRSLADVAGPPEGQRLRAPHVVPAGAQVQLGLRVMHRERQADADPADVVDDLLEPGEVDLDEMIKADPGRLLHGLPEAARAAVGERGVDLLDLARLRGLAGGACLRRTGQHRHDRVARDAEHDHVVPARRDVQDHDGV
jgi:hypothetical protein